MKTTLGSCIIEGRSEKMRENSFYSDHKSVWVVNQVEAFMAANSIAVH